MKVTLLIIASLWSFAAMADIVPPPPNYTVAADGTVTDSTGQVTDDPEQVVPLTTTEIPVVQTNTTAVGIKVKTDWNNRLQSAIQSATP